MLNCFLGFVGFAKPTKVQWPGSSSRFFRSHSVALYVSYRPGALTANINAALWQCMAARQRPEVVLGQPPPRIHAAGGMVASYRKAARLDCVAYLVKTAFDKYRLARADH